MRTKFALTSLLFCAIPVVGLWEGALPNRVGIPATGISSAQAYLPSLLTDFSDLDARDAQNRPISQPSANADLTSLFLENLVQLAVQAPLHSMQDAMDGIDSFSHLFKGLFYNALVAVSNAINDALAPDPKRVVHNVHNLWTTIAVAILLSGYLMSLLSFDRSPLTIHPRC